MDTVDGAERLTYPETRAADLAWTFDTTASIGGYTVDDPNYQFGNLVPYRVATDKRGNVYIFDSDAIRVLGYYPDGTYIGQWGREGGGPGEIGGSFVGGLAVGPGDTLWIADRPNARFTMMPLHDPDGEPTSMPLRESGNPMLIRRLVVDSAGPLGQIDEYVFVEEVAEGPPQRIVRFNRVGRPPVGQSPATLENEPLRDTLWAAPPRPLKLVQMKGNGGSFVTMVTPNFQPELHWAAFSDGGFAVQDRAVYEIHLLDRNGLARRIIRREPAPRPTTAADRQAVIDEILTPPEDGDDRMGAETRRQWADAQTFADVIPRVVELRVDAQDRLWVGVSEQKPGEVERIDVYDHAGVLLGELRQVPLPAVFNERDGAVLLDRDELDVQRVLILRLVERADPVP